MGQLLTLHQSGPGSYGNEGVLHPKDLQSRSLTIIPRTRQFWVLLLCKEYSQGILSHNDKASKIAFNLSLDEIRRTLLFHWPLSMHCISDILEN